MKLLLPLVPLLTVIAPLPVISYAKENTSETIELPFNEYNALKLLAKWKVSTTELPLYIDNELDDIYGSDNNLNLVRDDYEQNLLSFYQRPEYVVMGLLAAKKWDRLLDIYNNTLQFEEINQARAFITESTAINACYAHLQKIDNTLTSPIQAYFNTDARLTAKKSAEEKLLLAIGKQHKAQPLNTKPCSVFTGLLKTALNPDTTDYFDLKSENEKAQ